MGGAAFQGFHSILQFLLCQRYNDTGLSQAWLLGSQAASCSMMLRLPLQGLKEDPMSQIFFKLKIFKTWYQAQEALRYVRHRLQADF